MISEEDTPSHWESKKVGELCDTINGYAFDSSKFTDKDEGLPIVRIRDLNNKETEKNFIGEYRDRYLLNGGELLISMDGHFDIYKWSGGEALQNQRVCRLTDYTEDILKDFLHYYLSEPLKNIEEYTEYTTVKHLSAKKIRSIEVPVPPLEEQKAIVEKLEEIFNNIEGIQEAQEQAEEVYQDLPFSFFTSRVRDAETEIVDTGDLIEATQYGSSNATNSEGDGYPSLRMGNYNLRGEMDYSKIKYQEFEEEKEFEKYKLNEGDVLFNRTNSSDLVGKMCIYDGELEDAVFASYLIRVELDESKVLPEYFVTYMNSHLGEVERQGKLKQAVSQANINATELREMEMSIPSLEAQKEIVASLEYMRSKIDGIMSEVNRKSELVEDLPKVILAEAFNGGLVDFNPGSASDPNSDSDSIGSDVDKEGQQRLEKFD